jgi:hypothetical protein
MAARTLACAASLQRGAGAESALSGAEAHGNRSRTGDNGAVKFITFG